jgi:hypothetical protein
MKQELHRTIDRMRIDLTRVEILTAALSAFARPIPDYEPAFQHMQKMTRGAHQLGCGE